MSEPRRVSARAWCLGARLDLREIERGDVIARSPLTVRAGENGFALLFRFGSVVLVDLNAVDEAGFIRSLVPFVSDPLADPESELVEIVEDAGQRDRVGPSGTIHLKEMGVERLQIVAEILAKSVVLAQYEIRVAKVFDRIEAIAQGLGGSGEPTRVKGLLQEIGTALLIQTRTVGRVEITEKPDITWEDPELDRLYERLSMEYELRDRDRALHRKLDLIANTAGTYLELVQNRRSIRVEWYIVALIAIEIVLIVYDIFWKH